MHALLLRFGMRFADPAREAAFYAGYATRNLWFVRLMLGVGGALFLLFALWDRVIDPIAAERTLLVRALILAPSVWLAALLLGWRPAQRFMEPIMWSAAVISTASIAHICAMMRGGIDIAAGGINLIVLFVCALLPMRLAWYMLFALTTVLAYHVAQEMAAAYRPGMPLFNGLMLATALFLGGVSVAWRERRAREEYVIAAALGESRARVEELLHSMLPAAIVERMQAGERIIADDHAEVSIVFADLVGFTELSRRMPAAGVVRVLNRLFSAFDAACERHHMHKIKTIGDAYMAVGGLVSASSDPASDAADFALEMHALAADISAELDTPLAVRIGLHVGPVVAGVIGTSRPAFDCWGEAVNLASRLESVAHPGDVLLSEGARDALVARYPIEPLPERPLKGIGMTRVFRLTSAAPPPADPADGSVLGDRKTVEI